ncbi:MAG: hypothetical protein SP4CHLAM5_03230 [Chlamydiia bacterium]|nr:hypothetical protein [Chlamydiia bacterium]MCH9618197.1 hypothetical protein [Chlamydiia bacterium]MCH9624080.1 hypothetical protein [Chlamydiia bacterium]
MTYIEDGAAISRPYYGQDSIVLDPAETQAPTILEKVKESRGKPKTRLFPTKTDQPCGKSPAVETFDKISLPLPSEIEDRETYTALLLQIMTKLEKIEKEMADHAHERGEINAKLAIADISLLKKKMSEQDINDGSISYLKKIESLISAFLGGALLATQSPIALLAGGCLLGSSLLSNASHDLKDSGSTIDLNKLKRAAGSLAFIGNGVGALSGATAFRGLGLLMKVTGGSTALMTQAYTKKKAEHQADSTRLTSNIQKHQSKHKEAERVESSLGEDNIYIIGAIVRTLENEIDSIKHANKKNIQG